MICVVVVREEKPRTIKPVDEESTLKISNLSFRTSHSHAETEWVLEKLFSFLGFRASEPSGVNTSCARSIICSPLILGDNTIRIQNGNVCESCFLSWKCHSRMSESRAALKTTSENRYSTFMQIAVFVLLYYYNVYEYVACPSRT